MFDFKVRSEVAVFSNFGLLGDDESFHMLAQHARQCVDYLVVAPDDSACAGLVTADEPVKGLLRNLCATLALIITIHAAHRPRAAPARGLADACPVGDAKSHLEQRAEMGVLDGLSGDREPVEQAACSDRGSTEHLSSKLLVKGAASNDAKCFGVVYQARMLAQAALFLNGF